MLTKARRPLVDYLSTTALVDALINSERRLVNSHPPLKGTEMEVWQAIREDLLDELRSRQLQLSV